MYQCLHHLGVLAVIFFERTLLPLHSRQPVTRLAALGLTGIVVGAVIASTGEPLEESTLTAYVAMAAAVSTPSAYRESHCLLIRADVHVVLPLYEAYREWAISLYMGWIVIL